MGAWQAYQSDSAKKGHIGLFSCVSKTLRALMFEPFACCGEAQFITRWTGGLTQAEAVGASGQV